MFTKGAILRKGRETLSHPLPDTALYWGPVPKRVSNWGGRKDFSMLEIHTKLLVTDMFILLHGAHVFQGSLGEGDSYRREMDYEK